MNCPTIIEGPSNDKFNEIAKELKSLHTKIHILEILIQGYCDHPEFRRNEDMPYKDNDDIRVSYQCLKCGKYFNFNERQESFDEHSKHCENFLSIKFDGEYVNNFNLPYMDLPDITTLEEYDPYVNFEAFQKECYYEGFVAALKNKCTDDNPYDPKNCNLSLYPEITYHMNKCYEAWNDGVSDGDDYNVNLILMEKYILKR